MSGSEIPARRSEAGVVGQAERERVTDGWTGEPTHVRRPAPIATVPVVASLGSSGTEPLRRYLRAAPRGLLATQRLAGNAATTRLVGAVRDTAPALQRFTPELDGERVLLKPERGDTDADLDATLCVNAKDRRIAGRTRIDVTSCLPTRSVAAMRLGPLNCAEYVRTAMDQKPGATGKDLTWFDTPQLWKELLARGMTVTGLHVLQENGKVEPAQGLSWSDLSPRTGDIVFMNGQVIPTRAGEEPRQSGDNFSVTWDHVGVFVVRSRAGHDYHLAKDGDENITGLYRTGSDPEAFSAPGAYVRGVSSLMAYLGTSPSRGVRRGPARPEEPVVYRPGPQSDRYWALPEEERERVAAEVDALFRAQTGVTRSLSWDSARDRALARTWLELRDRVMADRPEPAGAGRP